MHSSMRKESADCVSWKIRIQSSSGRDVGIRFNGFKQRVQTLSALYMSHDRTTIYNYFYSSKETGKGVLKMNMIHFYSLILTKHCIHFTSLKKEQYIRRPNSNPLERLFVPCQSSTLNIQRLKQREWLLSSRRGTNSWGKGRWCARHYQQSTRSKSSWLQEQ